MSWMNQELQKKKENLNQAITDFGRRHWFSAYLFMLVGMPVFIILALFILIFIVAVPLSWIMGWV